VRAEPVQSLDEPGVVELVEAGVDDPAVILTRDVTRAAHVRRATPEVRPVHVRHGDA